MKFKEDHEFIPSPDLLPFGGFEVAVLLHRLQVGDSTGNAGSIEIINFEPPAREVSSGWLRSKLMCKFPRQI
jgi:hypothetical protein